MPDCTHRLALRLTLLAACAGALLAAAAAAPSPALADGDPASDVLASEALFVPADGGFPRPQVAQLSAMLASAQRQGVSIRVALVATPADLGSVGELWRKPQSYAKFLGLELSQVYRGAVVVIMPNGVGVVQPPARATLTEGTPGQRRTSLVTTAMRAVQGLATAAGHPVAPPPATVRPGSGSTLGSVDLVSWLALAAGAALIALAWTASLRARPPRPPRPPRLRRTR